MRVKLGQALPRTVQPHIFESRAEAQAYHDTNVRSALIEGERNVVEPDGQQ